MVHAVPLAAVNAVGVMAHTARRSQIDNVSAMPRKTLVAQNAVAAVASVAKGISLRTLRREVACFVVANEQWFKDRTVWPVGARAARPACVVAVVAISAGNHAAESHRRDQTHYVSVAARAADRME